MHPLGACLVRCLVLTFCLLSATATAAERYVRAGATGSGSGADWTNACPGFTGTCAVGNLARGDTYYIADGSYGSMTLARATSGTAAITFRKATASDHGTDVGWSSAYGDGQASFGTIFAVTDYWTFDGQVRDENNWSDTGAYGFRLSEVVANTINHGTGSSHMTFRYVDVGGPASTSYNAGNPDHGFYLGGFGSVLSHWVITRSHVHNVNRIPFQLAGASNIVIEYSWIGPNWNKETIRGQVRASDIVIRYNVLKNGCQNGPAREGCTADIGMWDGGNGAFDGSQIYGNLIWRTAVDAVSDGVIFIGGDGGLTAAGSPANNVVVYNNTIVSAAASGNHTIRFPGARTGTVASNNIWYLSGGAFAGCTANVCDNNSVYTSSPPFVNPGGGDFRLTGPVAGATLGHPYDRDMTGALRGGDGAWDRGAFEFGGATPPSPTSPSPPTNLRIVNP
ncbi:MAG: hypothetical protein IT182_01930 [Acidobacteria bacterium]|nr:hypothetical protein [Acidobacteriota bacterium]